MENNITCLRCGKDVKLKKSLTKHLSKTKLCDAIYLNITSEEMVNDYKNNYDKYVKIKESKKIDEKICETCEYCGKKFNSANNYYSHKKNSCKKNPKCNNFDDTDSKINNFIEKKFESFSKEISNNINSIAKDTFENLYKNADKNIVENIIVDESIKNNILNQCKTLLKNEFEDIILNLINDSVKKILQMYSNKDNNILNDPPSFVMNGDINLNINNLSINLNQNILIYHNDDQYQNVYESINKKDIKKIFYDENPVIKLIEHIHIQNDKHKNIYLPNLNNDSIYLFEKDKWNIYLKKTVINKLINNALLILKNIKNKYKTDENINKYFVNYDKFLLDLDINKKELIKSIEFLFINNKAEIEKYYHENFYKKIEIFE